MRQLLSNIAPPKTKQWIRSRDVRKILKISPGTLQNLRVNGTLRFSKVGGMIYYSLEEIEELREKRLNKIPK